MQELQMMGGILLVMGAVIDAFWTTFWIDGGGGPLTSAFLRALFIL
jgi:hypothetical protein